MQSCSRCGEFVPDIECYKLEKSHNRPIKQVKMLKLCGNCVKELSSIGWTCIEVEEVK